MKKIVLTLVVGCSLVLSSFSGTPLTSSDNIGTIGTGSSVCEARGGYILDPNNTETKTFSCPAKSGQSICRYPC
jgi:hypothetical protein